MPYKDPPKDRQFRSGQSGNPRGYSRKRRLADTLKAIIEAKGLDQELMMVALAKATGRAELLDYKDSKGKKRKRTPDFSWFTLVVNMVDGGTTGGDEAGGEGESLIGKLSSEQAAKIMQVFMEGNGPPGDDGPTD